MIGGERFDEEQSQAENEDGEVTLCGKSDPVHMGVPTPDGITRQEWRILAFD